MTVTPTVPKDTGNLRNSMFLLIAKAIKMVEVLSKTLI